MLYLTVILSGGSVFAPWSWLWETFSRWTVPLQQIASRHPSWCTSHMLHRHWFALLLPCQAHTLIGVLSDMCWLCSLDVLLGTLPPCLSHEVRPPSSTACFGWLLLWCTVSLSSSRILWHSLDCLVFSSPPLSFALFQPCPACLEQHLMQLDRVLFWRMVNSCRLGVPETWTRTILPFFHSSSLCPISFRQLSPSWVSECLHVW